MDKAKFEKIKLWGSIIVAVLCYFMFACLSYESIKEHQDFLVALLFLVFAINCTYRIRAHYKLERKRKSAFSEKEVAKAERRQGIASAVFSNATAGIYMLFMTVVFLLRGVKDKFILTICGVAAVCFIGLLLISIRNLKRFDKLVDE